MRHLFTGGLELGWVALKAMLLYLTAVFCFRVGRRRTIAEMSAYDFVAAVAVGAIVGRVPNSDSTSYLAGGVTLVTILFFHAIITRLRFSSRIAPAFDHSPRLLVAHGQLLHRELQRSGLTEKDLAALLREHQVTDLSELAFVILEQRGKVSIFRSETPGVNEGKLVREVVDRVMTET